MSEQHKQWIGIDICSNYLDIAIHPQGKTFRLANDDSGQAELVHRLSSYQVEGIVLEATGGIERAVMSVLETAGYQTRRVNPLQIRHFAKAAGRLAKTDKIDAETIAHFGQSLKPPVTLLVHLPELGQRTAKQIAALVGTQGGFSCLYSQLLGILNAMLRTHQPWCEPVPPAGLTAT